MAEELAHKVIPEGSLYRGTRTREDFRAILFQGILPSRSGTAGPGLYGVRKNNIEFAIQWAGSEDLVVKCHVAKNARVVECGRRAASLRS